MSEFYKTSYTGPESQHVEPSYHDISRSFLMLKKEGLQSTKYV